MKLAPAHIDDLPQWDFREEDTGIALSRVWPNLGALVILAFGMLLLGARSVRRYPIAG